MVLNMPIDIPYKIDNTPDLGIHEYNKNIVVRKCYSLDEAKDVKLKFGGMIITDKDNKNIFYVMPEFDNYKQITTISE